MNIFEDIYEVKITFVHEKFEFIIKLILCQVFEIYSDFKTINKLKQSMSKFDFDYFF